MSMAVVKPVTDYLENPPIATPPSIAATSGPITEALGAQSLLLSDIRRELLKRNPDVLTDAIPDVDRILRAGTSRRIQFYIAGKPVVVHKIILWSAANKIVRGSVVSMSGAGDGFTIGTTPIELNVSISEFYIALESGGTDVAVNAPSNLGTNGGVYVYGLTIPDYEK